MKKAVIQSGFILLLILSLIACNSGNNSSSQPPNTHRAFTFSADPENQTLSVTTPDGEVLGTTTATGPGELRILQNGSDLELKDFSFGFLPGNTLVIEASFRNITNKFNFLQPFTFSPSGNTVNIESSVEPTVTDADLGDDGILEPDEETQTLTFTVIHMGRPFTYEVLAKAAVEAIETADGPEFSIVSPPSNTTICRYVPFTVETNEPDLIRSVEFFYNGVSLGVDATFEDEFTVPFYTEGRDAGPAELKAVVTDKNGVQSAQSISIEIASGQAGRKVSQEELESTTGLNFTARNLRFLGAQEIPEDACEQEIIFLDVGDDIQPGETVLEWGTTPDEDGDGVAELIVINTGIVNEDGHVVSKTLPDIAIEGAAKVTSKSKTYEVSNIISEGVSAGAGAIVRVDVSGYPLSDNSGTLAVFKSLVNDETIEVETYLHYDASQDYQAVVFSLPQLPIGAGQLFVSNDNLGFLSDTIDVTFESLPALTRPAEEIINEFYQNQIDASRSANQDALSSVDDENIRLILEGYGERQLEALIQAQRSINTVLSEFDELGEELQQIFIYQAQAIENSRANPFLDSSTSIRTAQVDCRAFNFFGTPCPDPNTCTPPIPLTAVDLLWLFAEWFAPDLPTDFDSPNIDLANFGRFIDTFGFAYGAGKVAAELFSNVLSGVYYVGNVSRGQCEEVTPSLGAPQSIISASPATFNPTMLSKNLDPFTFIGMAALESTGGEGFGGAAVRDDSGTCTLQQEEARTIIKVSVGGENVAFDGRTNSEGFFYLPQIPAGRAYEAIAIDTVTGDERTLSGTGVPEGEVNFMYFDFCDGDFDPEVSLRPVQQDSDSFDVTISGRVSFDSITTIDYLSAQLNDNTVLGLTDSLASDGTFTFVLDFPVVQLLDENTIIVTAFTANGRIASQSVDFVNEFDGIVVDFAEFGETKVVRSEFEVPAVAADVMFLVDVSASYEDDLRTYRNQVDDIIGALQTSIADLRVGLGSFVDAPCFATSRFDRSIYGYRLNLALTDDLGAFTTALEDLDALGNQTTPESQLEAMYQAMTGEGRTTGLECERQTEPSIPPTNPGWQASRIPILIVATDAPFHRPTDTDDNLTYPYPTNVEDVIATAETSGTSLFFLNSVDEGNESEIDPAAYTIAEATGGSVFDLAEDSTGIVDAVREIIRLSLNNATVKLSPTGDLEGFVTNISPQEYENVNLAQVNSLPFDVTFSNGVSLSQDLKVFEFDLTLIINDTEADRVPVFVVIRP